MILSSDLYLRKFDIHYDDYIDQVYTRSLTADDFRSLSRIRDYLAEEKAHFDEKKRNGDCVDKHIWLDILRLDDLLRERFIISKSDM